MEVSLFEEALRFLKIATRRLHTVVRVSVAKPSVLSKDRHLYASINKIRLWGEWYETAPKSKMKRQIGTAMAKAR